MIKVKTSFNILKSSDDSELVNCEASLCLFTIEANISSILSVLEASPSNEDANSIRVVTLEAKEEIPEIGIERSSNKTNPLTAPTKPPHKRYFFGFLSFLADSSVST